MKTKSLQIKNFLNLDNIDIKFNECHTLIHGDEMRRRSILWSIIIYIEGFNIYCKRLEYNLNNDISLDINDDLCKCIKELYIDNYVTMNNNNTISTIKGVLNTSYDVNEINIFLECDIILINNDTKNPTNIIEGIEYSYMNNLLPFYRNSYNGKNFRNMYTSLGDVYKKEIYNHMIDMYGNIKIKHIKNSIYINVGGNKEVELMFQKKDFQIIFTSLIMLFDLINKENKVKYYLVEDPEVHLYHHILKKYISILKRVCETYNVYMIISSGNKHILNSTKEVKNNSYINYIIDNIKKFKNQSSNVDDEKYIDSDYLLIVEGSDELGTNGFFTKLRELYPVLHKFYMITKCSISNNAILAQLSMRYKEIVYVVDAEFRPPNIIDEYNNEIRQNKINIYYLITNLPCSESHLILDYFHKSDINVVRIKLNDYFSNKEHKESYFKGLKDFIPDDHERRRKCDEIWNSVLLEIKKDIPDFRFITSVIHGHSWVKMIGSSGKYNDIRIKNSKDWYRMTNFMEFDPSVRELLDTINNYILEILG